MLDLCLPWINMLVDVASTVRNRAHLKCGGAIVSGIVRFFFLSCLQLVVGTAYERWWRIKLGLLFKTLNGFPAITKKENDDDKLKSLSCNFLHQRLKMASDNFFFGAGVTKTTTKSKRSVRFIVMLQLM